MKSNPSLDVFPSAMVQACEAALDAGIFYDDDFDAFVFGRMGGFGCEAKLLELAECEATPSDYFKTRLALCQRIEALVIAAPRGHYAVLHIKGGGRDVYETFVSDGHHDALAVGGAFDRYDTLPTAEKVLERMVGYEIYICRHVLEAQRYLDKCVSAIQTYGLCVGYTNKGSFAVGGSVFSTVTIEKVFETNGSVQLFMTKRGSSRRFAATLGATEFVERAGLQHRAQQIEACTGGDLFSTF